MGQVRIDPILHQPLAPWWKRLIAILIDSVILFFAVVILLLIFAAIARHNVNSTNNPSATGGHVLGGLIASSLVFSIPAGLYYAVMNGSRTGQTVGKMALGIAVRDARTGAPIGFWRGLGRFAMTLVFEALLYVPFVLDSLAPLWDSRRQAWHDKVVHSVVVDLKP